MSKPSNAPAWPPPSRLRLIVVPGTDTVSAVEVWTGERWLEIPGIEVAKASFRLMPDGTASVTASGVINGDAVVGRCDG